MLDAVETAARLKCKRFVGVGSQAEYGVVHTEIIREDSALNPYGVYGANKAAACFLTRSRAEQLGIEWVWGRIFSLTGMYDPRSRMLPNVIKNMINEVDSSLSSCEQNWDYLDIWDGAEALISIAQRGAPGEIYNVANGEYRKLKSYIEEAKGIVAPNARIQYGADPDPFISLQPSVEKIKTDTGWKPMVSFEQSVCNIVECVKQGFYE